MRRPRTRRLTALLAIPALAIAGCGSTSQSQTAPAAATQPPTTATQTTPPGTTSTSTTTSSSTTSTTSTAPTAVAPRDTCQPDQLQLFPGRGLGAAGHYTQTLIFANVSSRACTLYGYPGVQLIASGGHPLPVEVKRGSTFFPDPGPSLVHLTPGGKASFTFGGPDFEPNGGAACPQSVSVRVYPPGDYSQLEVAAHVAACPGLRVAAVRPGTTSP